MSVPPQNPAGEGRTPGLDASEVAEPPTSKIPCIGCGCRDGLISPIKNVPAVRWCMRCGTLIDEEAKPLEAMLPQTLVHFFSAVGRNITPHQQAEGAEAQPEQQPTPEATPPPS